MTLIERARNYNMPYGHIELINKLADELERLQGVEKLWLIEVDRLATGWATPANRINEI